MPRAGTVLAAGLNTFGQLGDGTRLVYPHIRNPKP